MRDYFVIEKDTNTISCIKDVLESFPEYNYSGTSNNYNNALNTILKESPNLIFFNIDNVIENPFQFITELNIYSEDLPFFIAISSSKEKAYDAIKNGFIDFLLTPITDLELRKTILNFQKKNPVRSKKTICLKSYKDYRYLDSDDILYLKADNNTTDFHMSDGTVINAFKTLKTYEKILSSNFLRIHKSYIINKNHVSRIQFGKSICSIKKNKFDIPFTKTYLENVEFMKNSLTDYSCRSVN